MSSSKPAGSGGPRTQRCPLCGKSFLRENSDALPFCSSRCRTIDLGRWLGGDYALPGDPLDEDENSCQDESPDDD